MEDFLQVLSQYGIAGVCVAFLIWDRVTNSKNMSDILDKMEKSMTQITTSMMEITTTMNNINERLIIIETHMGMKAKGSDK